jgi:hypothetical protein
MRESFPEAQTIQVVRIFLDLIPSTGNNATLNRFRHLLEESP